MVTWSVAESRDAWRHNRQLSVDAENDIFGAKKKRGQAKKLTEVYQPIAYVKQFNAMSNPRLRTRRWRCNPTTDLWRWCKRSSAASRSDLSSACGHHAVCMALHGDRVKNTVDRWERHAIGASEAFMTTNEWRFGDTHSPSLMPAVAMTQTFTSVELWQCDIISKLSLTAIFCDKCVHRTSDIY